MIFLILLLIFGPLGLISWVLKKKRNKKIEAFVKHLCMIVICWIFFMIFLILLLIFGPLGSISWVLKNTKQNCYCNNINFKMIFLILLLIFGPLGLISWVLNLKCVVCDFNLLSNHNIRYIYISKGC